MRSRRVAVAAVCGVSAALALGGPSSASDPPSSNVTVPPAGQSVTVTWKGTIGPGANPTSNCNATVLGDEHVVNVSVPAGTYDNATAEAVFRIVWDNADNDEILTVNAPDGTSDSSDGGAPSEMVTFTDPKPGEHLAIACPFLADTPQPYTGTATITTRAKSPEPSVPSADPQGLQFSAAVPADPQRDEAEPLIEIDNDGRIYTCGPTGFSNASDYAQVSTDGGDQFHLLGSPPRGQQGAGGGGDCGLAMSPAKNADGFHQYAYAGLGPLTGFTTSTSPDGGRTIFNAGPQGNTNTAQGGGADRQWLTFINGTDVLLSYNQQQPRNVVVQKSTDGGFSYITGNDAIAAGDPDFPGPMRSMPARLVDPAAGADERVAYFGWNTSDADFSYVAFAISDPSGLSWKNCLVRKIPSSESGGLQAFTVADNDTDGNVYLTYSDKKGFHTWLTTLTVDKLGQCNQDPGTEAADLTDPGWSAPVQADRGEVRTTVFPWLAAGGAPGRVAVAFYGTETDGDPNPGSFKASWDVYVSQSVNALSGSPAMAQVKATTHPFHFDSICLRGLACDLSAPPGDRSLADFFAIAFDKTANKLSIVFNRTSKQPDESAGRVGTPMVVTQIAGPGNGGGTIQADPERAVVRSSADDPAGDALVGSTPPPAGGFSSLVVAPPSGVRTPASKNEPALDLRSERIGPEVDPATGAAVADGGFTATLQLGDLSAAALQQAMQDTASGSLLWVFTFANGFTQSAASARYTEQDGFTFGYNDYTTGSAQCGSSGEKCVVFPGDKPIKGKVDQQAGGITLSVPRSYLRALTGPEGPNQRPTETKATPGSRFYDATTFTFGNASPGQSQQSFMYPGDSTRAMDFLLPGQEQSFPARPPRPAATPTATPTATPATGGAPACASGRALRSARARPRRGTVRMEFSRRESGSVTVDVFQVSAPGRRVLRPHLIARFANRDRSFTWNGRANRRGRTVRDGFYFARFRMRAPYGAVRDTRRVALRRSHGRFSVRPRFDRPESCATLKLFKLDAPAFGGSRNRALRVAYRLTRQARVTLTVLRGKRVVRRYGTRTRAANRTFRTRFASRGRPRGDYRFRLQVVRGKSRTTVTLASRNV